MRQDYGLNERELATVLHALRKLVDPMNCNYVCGHFDDVKPLNDEEIDELCERLNCGEEVQEWKLEPDEHMPTLEGVIEYLEQQNDTAFLAYRRLERGSEPGMDRQVRERLSAFAYEVWQGTGDARNLAQEKAKPVLVPTQTTREKLGTEDEWKRTYSNLGRLNHAGDPLPHPMPDGETIEEWTARKQADERVKQQAAALEDPSAR